MSAQQSSTGETGQAPVASTTPPSAADARRFRPEIEGLRAVAAILVAVYHVFLGRVSGGVDVFFVVAGFLITTTLLGHLVRSGGVQPGTYFSRLAARLLPMALLVLLVILAATVLWMPVTRIDRILKEIAASAVYMENWALARQSINYLARDEALSPVQHFWALSIQGQFYLIWLTIFGAVAFIGRRLGRGVRPLLAIALGLTFVGSLAFSVYLTGANQPLAYFHTGTRMWEFAAGGLLALALPRLGGLARVPAWTGIAAGWAGLALILSCGLLITVSSSFPGWIALWPITGGLLVILAGEAAGSTSRWSSTRLLGSRPFVFLGGVSYAIYLWHWPLLTFYRSRAGEGPVSLLPGLAILAIAIGLAIVTTRLVERPVRTVIVPRLRPWPTVFVGGATAVLVAATAFGFTRLGTGTASAAVNLGSPDYPGAAATVPGFVYTGGDVPFAPDLLAAQRDQPRVYRNGCHQRLSGESESVDGEKEFAWVMQAEACSVGDPESDFTVVLVGGSHALQFFPALEEIAEARGWHLISATKSGCRFSANPQGDDEEGVGCAAWNAAALAGLVERRPDLVITTSTVTGLGGERVEDGFLEYWRVLEQAGIDVVGIRDTPRWPSSPLDCLGINMGDPGQCWVPRASSLDAVNPNLQLEDPPANVTFVDLTDSICVGERCPAVVGNVVAYYDLNHLSASYVSSLTPMLDAQLPPDARATGTGP